jgi:Helicase HerA, central domain/AAA ATPase domain
MTEELNDSGFLLPELAAIGHTACRMLDFGEEEELLGEAILLKVKGLIERKQVTNADVVRMALVADVLRVAEETILADEDVSEREVAYALPLVREAAQRLAAFRAYYESWRDLDLDGVRSFMKAHRADKQLFGGSCAQTRWLGLEIVLRLANETRDRGAFDRYSELMLRLSEEIVSLERDRVPSAEARQRIEERLGLRRKLAEAERHAPREEEDPRIRVFCSAEAPDVFHAVEHANQVWLRDPFDVESLQSAPRAAFARMLQRMDGTGRVLLVLGEAGSGKTHLMRAIRNEVHGQRAGYVGYMQLSGSPSDYMKYLLGNVIDSLEKPYDTPEVSRSGLMCLSDALLLAALPEQRERLDFESLSDDELGDLVFQLADQVLKQQRFSGLDLDVTRALLFLQSGDSRYYTRVVKYLRAHELGSRDADLLGGLASRKEDAFGVLRALAQIIASTDGGALVLLLDQLEEIHNLAAAKEQTIRLMDVVRHVSDNLPNSLTVITCLRDFYMEIRRSLAKPILDRIERDPDYLELKEERSEEDVKAIIGRRLEQLYERCGVRYREDQPCYPVPHEVVDRQRGLKARELIKHVQSYQQACIAAGRILAYDEWRPAPAAEDTKPVASVRPEPQLQPLSALWSEWRIETENLTVPTEDDELLSLLRWVMTQVHGGEGNLLVRMTNQTSRGGRLASEIEALRSDAKRTGRIAVAVRCSEFGGAAGSQLSRQLGKLAQQGGRRCTVDQASWRQLLAFQQFSQKHDKRADFAAWLREEQPLSDLEVVRVVKPEGSQSASVRPPVASPPVGPVSLPKTDTGQDNDVRPVSGPCEPPTAGRIRIGTVVSVRQAPAEIDLQQLKQHAAFLGASGSGKTSLALNVIEQAAERGIGVIMLDRKGDLATYADPTCWGGSDPDPKRAERMRALHSRLEVRVYTPGNPLGRSLRIRTVPDGLMSMPAHERAQVASFSAQALLSMSGTRADQQQLAILGKAIEVIASLTQGEPHLGDVINLIADQDESLLAEIGHLDPRHMRRLVDKLEALRITQTVLLESADPPLVAENLLGLDAPRRNGRVPMTILSTKFLGGAPCVDFWVSQLLIELSRWCSRSPSKDLQALLFLDEADAYMPASSKPATKDPLQGLLKRARSAGLGILLATQNPGDLDYRGRDNIATWWVGRIASSTAIDKMKPLLSECKVDISSALANQSTGEFFQIYNGNAQRIRSERSLMSTTQLGEDRIVELAKASAAGSKAVA